MINEQIAMSMAKKAGMTLYWFESEKVAAHPVKQTQKLIELAMDEQREKLNIEYERWFAQHGMSEVFEKAKLAVNSPDQGTENKPCDMHS